MKTDARAEIRRVRTVVDGARTDLAVLLSKDAVGETQPNLRAEAFLRVEDAIDELIVVVDRLCI